MPRQITVTFPACARADDIATALALAANSSFTLTSLEADSFQYKRPTRLSVNAILGSPGLAFIEFVANGDTGPQMHVNYHYEFGRNGERGMLAPYNATWLAIVWAVVERLGGSILVDEDGDEPDLQVPSQWPADPEDADFEAMHTLLDGVRGVTEADIEAANKLLDQSYLRA